MDKRLYKDIVDSLPYAFLVLDKELRVIQCNQNCEHLFSLGKEEILNTELSKIIPHRELRIQAEAVTQNRGTKLVELSLEAEEPKLLRAVITALSEEGKSGNMQCLITLEDISERARLEGYLVQSEKLAGMGLLASTIAHELGNPLSIMTSTLQYIRDTILNAGDRQQKAADIVEAIETIMDSTGQMHELLHILSGFTGSHRPRFESVDLCQVLSQMVAFIHNEAEAHRIMIHHQFDSDLPDCQVNLREVKQLFLNLLKNAIEAMPNGGELRIAMYLAKSKNEICIDISDTGHGIGETELLSIFRPFYSTKTDGTGLGLPFCRRVMEEHGGEIRVKSALRKGSTFSMILPVRQEDDI